MPRSGSHWGDLLGRFESWLLPAECLLCHRRVLESAEPLVCRLCRARWTPVPSPHCPRCGQPLPLAMACRLCREWPADLDLVRSAVMLEQPVRELLHQFKYHGWRRLAQAMAVPMLRLLDEVGPGDLVPVAMGSRRRRSRGYNQAQELAHALAALSGRRVDATRLWRCREVGSQTRLGLAERMANLAQVFAARPDEGAVVLVDDVFTTGATLVSAATACLDAGAIRVGAVTFARAEPPLAAAGRRTLNTGA